MLTIIEFPLILLITVVILAGYTTVTIMDSPKGRNLEQHASTTCLSKVHEMVNINNCCIAR